MKSYIFLTIKLIFLLFIFSIEQNIGWFFLTIFSSFWLLLHSYSDVEYWLLHVLITLLFLSVLSINLLSISLVLFLVSFLTNTNITNFFSQNLIVGSIILSITFVLIKSIAVYPTTIVYAFFSLLVIFYISRKSLRVKDNISDEFETRFL